MRRFHTASTAKLQRTTTRFGALNRHCLSTNRFVQIALDGVQSQQRETVEMQGKVQNFAQHRLNGIN
jgi:hypothetical protein